MIYVQPLDTLICIYFKNPQKEFTKNKRGANGEQNMSDRGEADNQQGTLLNPQLSTAADWDLDPSTMSGKCQTKTLFRAAIFDNFWSKIGKYQTNVLF